MFVVGIVIFLLELEAYKYSNRHPHFFFWEPELLMATEFKKLQASEQGRTINQDWSTFKGFQAQGSVIDVSTLNARRTWSIIFHRHKKH